LSQNPENSQITRLATKKV